MVDRLRRTLTEGVTRLDNAWKQSGVDQERIDEVFACFDAVEWVTSSDGINLEPLGVSPAGAGLRIAILEREPHPKADLNSWIRFQAHPHVYDNVPTVFVRRDSYTPLWSGLSLVHELKHALDYRDGLSTVGEHGDPWNSAEGRVHAHEAMILDAISDGEMTATVGERSFGEVSARARGIAGELAIAVPPRLRREPPTPADMRVRDASLIMTAGLLSAVRPRPLDEVSDEELGEVYRKVVEAARNW